MCIFGFKKKNQQPEKECVFVMVISRLWNRSSRVGWVLSGLSRDQMAFGEVSSFEHKWNTACAQNYHSFKSNGFLSPKFPALGESWHQYKALLCKSVVWRNNFPLWKNNPWKTVLYWEFSFTNSSRFSIINMDFTESKNFSNAMTVDKVIYCLIN